MMDRVERLEEDLAEMNERLTSLQKEVVEAVASGRSLVTRVDSGDERDHRIQTMVDGLDQAVHQSYAGRGGIGPELLANIRADELRDRSIDQMERRIDHVAQEPAAAPVRTGVAGIIDVSADRATETVEGLSERGFKRLVTLAVLACVVLAFVALLLFAKNSGYNVTTSGDVNVRGGVDEMEVDHSRVEVTPSQGTGDAPGGTDGPDLPPPPPCP